MFSVVLKIIRYPHCLSGHQVSQGSSKMVSWGTLSFDDDNSDSGRGTEVSEKEIKPTLDEGEKVNVKVSVGLRG